MIKWLRGGVLTASLFLRFDVSSAQTRLADPDVPPSVVYAGAIDVDPTGRAPADIGFGIDVNEQINPHTRVTALFVRGNNPGIVHAFRYGLHEWRLQAGVEHRGWKLAVGELRAQRRLFGAPVVGDGLAVAREKGGVIGSLTIARPKYFSGNRGGHLLEGHLGLRRDDLTVRAFASDVALTSLKFSPTTSLQLPEDDSELTLDDLAELGLLLPRENRIRTGGIDVQLRRGAHSLLARAALVEQANDAGAKQSGVAVEGSYNFVTPRTSFVAAVRQLPKVLPGIELPASTAAVSSRIRLTKTVKTIVRGHGAESLAFGRIQPTRTLGGSAGVEYGKSTARLEVLANYREARTISLRRSRTVSAAFRMPMKRVTAEGRLELGRADVERRIQRIAHYRTGLHVDLDATSIMLGASYQDYGSLPPRSRIDLSVSTTWRGLVSEFGIGAGRSQLFGDDVGAWINLDVPLPASMVLNVGLDYERWLYATSRYVTFAPDARDLAPPWRFTVSLRKHLAFFDTPD
jgi:hypothetical protein